MIRPPPGDFRLLVDSSHGQTALTDITVTPEEAATKVELRVRETLRARPQR